MDKISRLLISFSEKAEKTTIPKVEKRVNSNMSLIDELSNISSMLLTDSFQKFCDTHDTMDSKIFEESKEFISSVITLSDWYEQMKDGSAMGLVVKVNTDNLLKIGVRRNLKIESITTTFMPIVEYLDSVITYFNDKKHDFGNLNYWRWKYSDSIIY